MARSPRGGNVTIIGIIRDREAGNRPISLDQRLLGLVEHPIHEHNYCPYADRTAVDITASIALIFSKFRVVTPYSLGKSLMG